MPHTGNLPHWITWLSAVSTPVLASVTGLMAWKTWAMAKETKAMAKSSQTAAEATKALAEVSQTAAEATKTLAEATQSAVVVEQRSLIQGQDALMPMVELSIEQTSPTVAAGLPLGHLILRNQGAGPAEVHDVTTRNDLDPTHMYQWAQQRVIVPLGGMAKIPIYADQTFSLPHEKAKYLSSLSVWYQDVYRRSYRSRLTFHYQCHATGDSVEIVTQAREFYRDITIPPILYGGTSIFHASWLMENGRVVPQYPGNLSLVRLDAPDQIRLRTFDGCAATLGRPYSVLNWGFWLDSSTPQFTIAIFGYPPFVLGRVPQDGRRDSMAVVIDETLFQSLRTGAPTDFALPSSDQLSLWGLMNTEDISLTMIEMYETTLTAVIHRLTGEDPA